MRDGREGAGAWQSARNNILILPPGAAPRAATAERASARHERAPDAESWRAAPSGGCRRPCVLDAASAGGALVLNIIGLQSNGVDLPLHPRPLNALGC